MHAFEVERSKIVDGILGTKEINPATLGETTLVVM